MKRTSLLLFVSAFAAAHTVAAAGLANEPVVFRSGKWEVRRGQDAMTDQISCTGIHSSGPRVQLSDRGFYVGIQGGVRGVTVRYDNDPPQQMRLATEMEKKVRAVIFDGADFDRVQNAKRVRIQVMTVLDQVAESDIDLTGIDQALQNIRSGCPVQSTISPSLTNNTDSAQTPPPPACSDAVKAKLKARGMKPAQIAEICG